MEETTLTTAPEAPAAEPTREEMIAKIEKELADHKESTKNKKYAVKSDEAHLALLVDFLEKEAKWSGMEALGVIELHKKFSNKDILKSGFMYLSKLELDAMGFFHSSAGGKGFKSANAYISMIKPFNEPLKEAKQDYEHGNMLEMKLASVREGIDLAPAVEKESFDEKFDEETVAQG
jgi:hypothetical protein